MSYTHRQSGYPNRLFSVLSFALILLTAADASGQERTNSLTSIRSVSFDQLRALFNRDAGTPRLILLLSPT